MQVWKRTPFAALIRRLRRDDRGNVLIITAASMFLLIGMGGGALDISRLYLVKSRLQQACDAGVLAYRRSMNGTNVVQPDHAHNIFGTWETAQAYFNTNFAPGLYGTTSTSFPEPTVDANVVVHGQASTTLPMTLMRLFGINERSLTAVCDAQLQLPNTDVMFVLDTTASMTDTNSGDSVNKISALRTAVANFYNTLESAKIAGTQVRYGFVPYSNTVNVGMLLKREWMADTAQYQSRVFDIQTRTSSTQPQTTTSYSPWTPVPASLPWVPGDPENCVAPASTLVFVNQPSSAWSSDPPTVPRSRTNYRTANGSSYSAASQGDGTCRITETRYDNVAQQRTETVSANPNAGTTTYSYQNYWTYQPFSWNVSVYKGSAANGLMAGSSAATFPVANPAGGTPTPTIAGNKTVSWTATNACIEERKTLRPGETGTAWDMDVDSVPNPANADTQWKPFLPGLVFARSVTNYAPPAPAEPTGWTFGNVHNASDYVALSNVSPLLIACPSPARKLMTKEAGLTASALQTYLNSLATRGVTYHDIGFLWGLRLISKEGLFGAENTSAPNGGSISRNIIFMTDGKTETKFQAYDAYGLSALDQRRTVAGALPTNTQQDAIVEDRLTRYCNIAKNQKGITVWVISFGDAADDSHLTSLLTGCASSGRFFRANNAAQLNATFAEIAAKIAQLRLTR